MIGMTSLIELDYLRWKSRSTAPVFAFIAMAIGAVLPAHF